MMLIRTKRQVTLLVGTVLLLASAVSARADYFFNFNSLTPSTVDQSAAIATYMNNTIGGACAVNQNCVTVSAGVAVAQKYNGDGHVTGPGTGGTSLTLGNTDGATASNSNSTLNGTYDSYLSNVAADSNGNNPSQLSQQIVITFSHGISLTGTFSFDYEVFPDGTCAQLTVAACGAVQSNGHNLNQPDLDFVANGTTPVNTIFWGVTPGTTNGTATHSPLSGSGSAELAPQLIGTATFSLNGATSLSFIDWPAAIGVDNLKLVTTPEPTGGVFLLGGLALAALAGAKLRSALVKS